MIKTNIFNTTDSHKVTARQGRYSLIEYDKDLSISPEMAETAYYASAMNIRKRQVVAQLNNDGGVILQAGAMQLMIGNVKAATNVKGVGDLARKFVGSKVTGETTIKPRYEGNGLVVLEPTYRYVIFEDLANWNGSMVIEDGMFLACDDTADIKVTARTTISSTLLGNEGFFNTALYGKGVVVLESPVPYDELIVVDLEDDAVKIDGNMAIAWSNTLKFTVEKTTKTLIGSEASGEELVNVYRGTGRILIAPVSKNYGITIPEGTDSQ